MHLNCVYLIGRVGQDPDIKYFESGSVVAKLSLAVRRGRDTTDWFACEFWGKTAQVVADYVNKGSQIGIQGALKIEQWTDRNTGNARSRPVIRCDKLELLGSRRNNDVSEDDEF